MIARLLICALALAPLTATAGIKVQVEGISGDEKTNVMERLAIADAAARKDLDQALVERLHAQADDDIRKALQVYGWYEPQIKAELSGEAPDWTARYTVSLGAPVLVDHVEILLTGEGAEFPQLVAASQHPLVHEGRQLEHRQYEDTKARLVQRALASGFLDAQFTRAQLLVTPAEHRAEVLLTLDTGPRYYFGSFTVEQEGLQPELVERYVRITPGGPYDPQQVLDTQFALADLDYFQSVQIIPQRDRMFENHIPILIKTTPRPLHHYETGAGYGTDTGARITEGVEFRRLNRYGHKLRLNARVSQIKDVLGAEYRIPLGSKSSESMSFTAESTREKFDDGRTLQYGVGASLNRTPGRWQRRVYLQYDHEESTLPLQEITADLVMPGVSFNRGETDDPIHTRRGWNLFLDAHGADKDVLSTATFLQLHGTLRAAYPLTHRLRLYGRGELGATFASQFSELPISQRFYAGGDQSVRGYAYRSLGPRDALGNVVGGRYLTVGSIEADYRIVGNWGAALFADAGGVQNNPWPSLSRGVGFGARYRAPVGDIDVDIAWPLDGDTRSPRLHLGIRVGL
ncbi:MAG TPA: autotransporter assembly complex family protein [Nevskiaceae bacterium]|nr:autotransporter assembly complex family protein [Nevskiaceae bacterium]